LSRAAPCDKRAANVNDLRHSATDREGMVGRGGLKLEAAIASFHLQGAIRQARAVDVGASTGGFTEVLLHHGAAHVLAVDAGHGQLHERLKADGRVQNLERTDWKRLSLSQTIAAGPFDFFTVDVSFVAARNMLRGLAFRLRPGAVGVVLIKPQFELPDHLVKRGDVQDPGLRRLAVSKFAAKALALGFEVRRHIDSPVPGGEGTVEILAELVFHGRTDRLPALPGAEAPPGGEPSIPRPRPRVPVPPTAGPRAPRSPRLSSTELHRWFAVTAPGTEEIAATELVGLATELAAPHGRTQGGEHQDVRAVPGGVEWRGTLQGAFRANLQLRVPTRILLRQGDLRAREFGKLRYQLARLPWEHFVAGETPLRVSVSATRSRLYHTGAIEEALLAAVGDRLGTGTAARARAGVSAPDARDGAPPDGAAKDDGLGSPPWPPGEQRVLLRGVEDVWTVSIDTSGDRLHRRGWRTDSGEAPLRETLAAALLYFAGWRPGVALVDAMCGAGTLPIEAATMALGLWPGARRAFAFERWPGLSLADRAGWGELKGAALASPGRASSALQGAPISASDHDEAAIAATRANAHRAGVADHLRIAQLPMNEVEPPARTGVFVANPPYGERLGTRRDLPALYRAMGGLLRGRFAGWSATVVVPDVRLASAFRLPVAASQRLTHGGLRVTLLRFAPWERGAKQASSPEPP